MTAMAAAITISAVFVVGVISGVVGLVTLSIRREERNRTLVAWPAPDRATYAARSLNGVYVRVPALCRTSRRNATRVRPAYPGSRPARVP